MWSLGAFAGAFGYSYLTLQVPTSVHDRESLSEIYLVSERQMDLREQLDRLELRLEQLASRSLLNENSHAAATPMGRLCPAPTTNISGTEGTHGRPRLRGQSAISSVLPSAASTASQVPSLRISDSLQRVSSSSLPSNALADQQDQGVAVLFERCGTRAELPTFREGTNVATQEMQKLCTELYAAYDQLDEVALEIPVDVGEPARMSRSTSQSNNAEPMTQPESLGSLSLAADRHQKPRYPLHPPVTAPVSSYAEVPLQSRAAHCTHGVVLSGCTNHATSTGSPLRRSTTPQHMEGFDQTAGEAHPMKKLLRRHRVMNPPSQRSDKQ